MKISSLCLLVMMISVMQIILLPTSHAHAQTLDFESFNATNPMTSQFNHTISLEKQASQYYLNDTQTALAINLAKNSTQFQSAVKGYNYTLGSIFENLGSSPQGGFGLRQYGVVFDLYKGPIVPGKEIEQVYVFEDPTLTRIFNITSMGATPPFGGVAHPTVPEFPFALPILVISLASLLIFYRIKFKIKHTKSVL